MPGPEMSALDRALPILRCPVCGETLARVGSSLRCPNRHSFDIARHGYASLLSDGRPRSGDDAPMARARLRFLAAGHFAPIRAGRVASSATAARSWPPVRRGRPRPSSRWAAAPATTSPEPSTP